MYHDLADHLSRVTQCLPTSWRKCWQVIQTLDERDGLRTFHSRNSYSSEGAAGGTGSAGGEHGWNLCRQHGAPRQGPTTRLPPENHQPFWGRWGLGPRIADPGVPDAPVRLDLGEQERTPDCPGHPFHTCW